MTVHAYIADEGEMRLVKVEVERGRIFTDRSTDEFSDWSFVVVLVRFYETVHAHVRLERGLDPIEVFHRDSSKFLHGYTVLSISLVQRLHSWFQPTYVASPLQGQTSKETQVISVPSAVVGIHFQPDDCFVLLNVDRKGTHSSASYRVIDDAIDEKGGVCHVLAHPRGIRSLIDGPLQDVGFSDSFQKLVKVLAVGYETGFVQVPSATVTRRVIIPVSIRVLAPQHECVTEVNLEGGGLFLEHVSQRCF